MSTPLTPKQKERIHSLEPKLEIAVQNRNYKEAKSLVADLQAILRPTSHFARLCQSKNRLFELAIEMDDFDFAISGLLSNKTVLSTKTRIYLETISLLAICYVRMQDIEKAKPYIKEVLSNQTIIKSQRTREVFRSKIINRFNEEVALATLKTLNPIYDEQELEDEAVRIIRTLTEDEIYASIGATAPNATKELIHLVYDFSTKQLTTTERLSLPSPNQKTNNIEVGLTIYQSIKRVIYNSLCDPNSEIYKAWFTNGLSVFLSKGYIRTTVVSCLVNLGIGINFLAASIIALITKFGIEVFCEKNKPFMLMDIRQK